MKKFIVLLKGFSPLQRKGIIILSVLLFAQLMLTSCWKNRFDTANIDTPGQWSPEVVAPLVHSHMTMKDVLNDWDHNNLFEEDATHFLYIVYWCRVFSQKAGDYFAIPMQNINTGLTLTIPGTIGAGVVGPYTLPAQNITYSFAMPGGEVLTKTILNDPNGGYLFFNIPGSLNQNATINISIPSATKSGIPFSRDLIYTANMSLIDTINLDGYQILFDNNPPNVNAVTITYTVTIHGTGNPNNSPYNLSLNESMQMLSFHELFGDFKQQVFSLPNDTVHLRIFQHNVYGLIDFENPIARLIATNSYGVPIRINMSNFRAYSPVNPPNLVVLTGYPVPWDIPAPSIAQIGQVDTTSFTLDKTNSNLKNAVNLSPHTFIVDFASSTNPAGGISSNFVVDTNRLAADLQIELPLYGKAWDFRVADTFNFSFSQNMDMIEYLFFRINIDNDFPVDAIGQIYFLDNMDHPLDSLLVPAQQVVSAAPVGPAPDYKVTNPVSKRTETIITQPRLKGLENTKKMVVLGKMATISAGTQIVKIYSFEYLDVQVGAMAKFKVNIPN